MYINGETIKTLRLQQKLTQKQLAESINVSEKAVSKWETGKGLPDSSIMMDLCNILDISVNDLLSGEKIEKREKRKIIQAAYMLQSL